MELDSFETGLAPVDSVTEDDSYQSMVLHDTNTSNPDQADSYDDAVIYRLPYTFAAEEPQIMQSFVNSFLPADPYERHRQAWLPAAMHQAHQGPDKDAATLSLRALAMIREGFRYYDMRMVQAAQESYGLALRALQQLLYAPTAAGLNTAIAACRFLVCYEMFIKNGNATEPDTAWTVHQAGLEQLLNASGQQRMDCELLMGTADMAMRKAIAKREAPTLKSGKRQKLEDQVWQLGMKYASILHRLDRCVESAEGTERREGMLEGLLEQMTRLIKLDQQLQSWYMSMSLAKAGATSATAAGGHTIYTFPHLVNAQLVVVHWTLRILVSRTISQTLAQHPELVATSSQPKDLEVLLALYSKTQRSELAISIMRCAWYFSNETYHATGFIRYSFAYHHALDVLLEDPAAVAANPWLKCLPLGLFSHKGIPIHGLPPPKVPDLTDVCVMTPFVKLYYNPPRHAPSWLNFAETSDSHLILGC